MPSVELWFYSPSASNSGWLNRVVSFMDPPYCHCELQFQDGMACCIYMGCAVNLKQRTFDPQYYHSVRVPCSSAQHNAMRRLAHQLTAEAVQFSTLNMTGAVMWGAPIGADNTTFCSKLCADLLLEAGLLPESVDSSKITPSCLCRMLAAHVPQGCPALGFRPSCAREII